MTDVYSPETRANVMRAVKARDTKPELQVRRLVRAVRSGYRLDARDVTGRPDIVFRRTRHAIFVHGCFWHGHDCRGFKWPKTREQFWRSKIEANQMRDAEVQKRISVLGWNIEVVWECQLRVPSQHMDAAVDRLAEKIRSRHGLSSA